MAAFAGSRARAASRGSGMSTQGPVGRITSGKQGILATDLRGCTQILRAAATSVGNGRDVQAKLRAGGVQSCVAVAADFQRDGSDVGIVCHFAEIVMRAFPFMGSRAIATDARATMRRVAQCFADA
jgi:hypothetical protein